MENKTPKNWITIVILLALTAALGVFSVLGDAKPVETADGDSAQALTNQKLIVKREANLQITGDVTDVGVGDTVQVEADARTPVTITIADPDIATIDENGNIKCNKQGKTKVTISAEGNGTYEQEDYQLILDVKGLKQKITGCEESYNLNKEEELQLEPSAKTNITFKSETPEIATVDENGTVHGVEGGDAIIDVIAQSDGEYREVTMAVSVKVSAYSIEERNEMAIDAAIKWAHEIADDNSFHYGKSKWAHHHGCYFCGTNQAKGSEKRKAGGSLREVEKTYCCNPFVTAAFAHGAGAPEIDCKVGAKRINLANDRNRALKNTDAFVRVSKPSSTDGLKKGDILLTPTHAMLYAGDGYVLEAAHHDNGKKDAYWNDSIRYAPIKAKQWKRVSKIYRYIGTGSF
ncbi:MAG: Ig-like domain-containing protein [Eubacterium sp.]|nr:Ig-like domain-containing protein [Candidatus Colimonas fimequi]